MNSTSLANSCRHWKLTLLLGLGLALTLPTLAVNHPEPPVHVPLNGIPVIADFSPQSATNGALITISGVNFSPTAANDVVRFGAIATTPVTAFVNQLTVLVPPGATLAPITVTTTDQGLTGASSRLFVPTFNGDGSPFTVTNLGTAFTLAAGSSPGYILIADLDGDGKPDVADVDGNSHTISIFHNIGTGGGGVPVEHDRGLAGADAWRRASGSNCQSGPLGDHLGGVASS